MNSCTVVHSIIFTLVWFLLLWSWFRCPIINWMVGAAAYSTSPRACTTIGFIPMSHTVFTVSFAFALLSITILVKVTAM